MVGIDPERQARFSKHLEEAEKGNTYAMLRVISAYRVGVSQGVYRNENQAEYWQKKRLETFLKKANEGDHTSMIAIATIYKFGEGVDPDPDQEKYWMERRFKTLLRKAKNNDKDAIYMLSMAYKYGQGTEENQIEYENWNEKYLSFKKKKKDHDVFIGVYLPSKLFESIQKFKKLKAYNDSEAVTFLCKYALENIEKISFSYFSDEQRKPPSSDLMMTRENLKEVLRLYELAESGHSTSMYLLWKISEEGLGAVEDEDNEYREMYREETWRLFNERPRKNQGSLMVIDPEYEEYEAFCNNALDRNL